MQRNNRRERSHAALVFDDPLSTMLQYDSAHSNKTINPQWGSGVVNLTNISRAVTQNRMRSCKVVPVCDEMTSTVIEVSWNRTKSHVTRHIIPCKKQSSTSRSDTRLALTCRHRDQTVPELVS